VYQGILGSGVTGGTAGNCTTSACPLWSTKADLEAYDIAVLACEGGEHTETKTQAEMQNMHDWLNEGGKVFATHFHYVWFQDGPADFRGVAGWQGTPLDVAFGGGTYDIDTTFPKGSVLAQWLKNVGATTGNTIALNGVADSVSTVKAPTQQWIYGPDRQSKDVKYLSFLTPIGGANPTSGTETTGSYCGKAVFTDLHAAGIGNPQDIPGSCRNQPLTAQEEALEFLFFDLSACVSTESGPPPPPPPTAR
jgi:hypothetical protein